MEGSTQGTCTICRAWKGSRCGDLLTLQVPGKLPRGREGLFLQLLHGSARRGRISAAGTEAGRAERAMQDQTVHVAQLVPSPHRAVFPGTSGSRAGTSHINSISSWHGCAHSPRRNPSLYSIGIPVVRTRVGNPCSPPAFACRSPCPLEGCPASLSALSRRALCRIPVGSDFL